MPVYFFNKNPNVLFPGASSYSKDEVDGMFSGLTTDGVTQSGMTYAIEEGEFISESEINSIMDDYTINYISQTSINSKFVNATSDFWTADEIDSTLSGDTSYYYNSEEIDIYASGKTANYPTSTEVYDDSYSAVEVSQLYWHPAPYYKRTLATDGTEYTLGGNIGNTTEIYVSGNTYWEVEEYSGGKSSPQSSWYSLSQSTGTVSVEITVTADENNNTGSIREVDLRFSSVQVNGSPFIVTLTQNKYVIPK